MIMVAYYIDRIKKGKIELDQVPARWRADVEREMENGKNYDLSK